MGLISEFRTSLENPQTPLSFPAEWLLDIFNGGRTDSGIRVSEMIALQVATVLACVELKAGAVASLDFRPFEKTVNPDGRLNHRIAYDHDLWDLIHDEPNPEMSSFTMRKTVQAHRMLWGNGYIEIQRDRFGRVIALWPRNPARIKPRRALKGFRIVTSDGIDAPVRPGAMVYATTEGMESENLDPESPTPDPAGPHNERFILPEDLIHLPGLSLDGRLGLDVVQLGRNAIGLALATERFGGKFFGNGALGYGIFKLPGNLAPEDFEVFKREVNEAWGGENMQRPLVLQGGQEYQSTSTKPNEGQFTETRNHQIGEVCRVMGNVPPHMVGVTEKSSRANVEQVGQEFLTFSLRPDLRCWEQEFRRKLFPHATIGRNAGRRFNVSFDTWPLITPAAADLRQFIQAMVQWGVWAPNDARARLNDNPIESDAADSTWMQINMAPVDQLFDTPALPAAAADEQDDEKNGGDNEGTDKPAKTDKSKGNRMLVDRVCKAYSRLFRDAFGRVSTRSSADLKTFRQVFAPVLVSIGEELEQHAAQLLGTVPTPDGFDNSRFLTGYLETMLHRCENEGWASANGHSGAESDKELRRAVRALAVEAYRIAATAAAKEETNEVHS